MFSLLVSVLILSVHYGQCEMEAMANLQLDGTTTSIGTIKFEQDNANSPVHVTGTLNMPNLSGTAHGFHVHTVGVAETSPNCTAALGHFNPYNVEHGPRDTTIMRRHVGDLGNLTVDSNGMIKIDFMDSIIQLYNQTQSIVSRTVIIHQMSDDGGSTGVGTSNTTGNAGARVACGLIKLYSHGLNIQPTVFVLFLATITTLLMSSY